MTAFFSHTLCPLHFINSIKMQLFLMQKSCRTIDYYSADNLKGKLGDNLGDAFLFT